MARTTASRGPSALSGRPPQAAHKRQQNTKKRRLVLLLTGLFFFAYVAAETAPPLFGPAQAALGLATGLAPAELSTMPSILSAGAVAGGLLSGQVFAAVTTSRACLVLVAALLAGALANACMPQATTLPMMSAVSLAVGMANGLFRAGANCLVLRVHGDDAAPYMNALHLFGGAGRMLAPATLAYFLSPSSSPPREQVSAELGNAFQCVSMMSVVAATCLIAVVWQGDIDDEHRTKKTKKKTQTQTHKKSDDASSRILMAVGAMIFLFTGVQSTFQNFVSSYALGVVRLSAQDSVMAAGVFGSAFTAGRVLSVPLSIRLSPYQMMVGDAIGVTVSLCVLGGFGGESASRQALFWGTGCFGLSMASMFASLLNFAKMGVTGVTAREITLLMQLGSAGAIFAPLAVVAAGGEAALLPILGTAVCVGNLLICLLPQKMMNQHQKQKQN